MLFVCAISSLDALSTFSNTRKLPLRSFLTTWRIFEFVSSTVSVSQQDFPTLFSTKSFPPCSPDCVHEQDVLCPSILQSISVVAKLKFERIKNKERKVIKYFLILPFTKLKIV